MEWKMLNVHIFTMVYAGTGWNITPRTLLRIQNCLMQYTSSRTVLCRITWRWNWFGDWTWAKCKWKSCYTPIASKYTCRMLVHVHERFLFTCIQCTTRVDASRVAKGQFSHPPAEEGDSHLWQDPAQWTGRPAYCAWVQDVLQNYSRYHFTIAWLQVLKVKSN